MSEEEQIKYLNLYPSAIRRIINPSETVKLTAVNKNGYLIRFIKDPSDEVQLAAVKQILFSIDIIQNPSKDVIMFALLEMVFRLINERILNMRYVDELLDKFSYRNYPEIIAIRTYTRNPIL